ncbi:hypothetical protein HHI36_011432 [Cryptolaemus montrouzieri]|uniref:Uncharacterized protein n=1 Tax=Cryptolaemus montrouzieri TaxID=559131 RepID=A0ABD2MLP6_9CUCU
MYSINESERFFNPWNDVRVSKPIAYGFEDIIEFQFCPKIFKVKKHQFSQILFLFDLGYYMRAKNNKSKFALISIEDLVKLLIISFNFYEQLLKNLTQKVINTSTF